MSPSAVLVPPVEPMNVHSDLLGPIEVDPAEVIEFSTGLYGFPECRRFVLVPAPQEGLFWLQSVDHSTLVFLLVDPFPEFDGYGVELPPADLRELRVNEKADVAILAIVTLPRNRGDLATANLQGPLALNLRARCGKQVAVEDSRFGVRCPFTLR